MSHAILRARHLDHPDGRALCRYALTDEELDRLVQRLRNLGPHAPDVAATFCLAGAELWRRHYDGGLWRFEVILERLGLDWHVPSPQLTPLITRGLRYWRRPILALARHEYLGSIAREAGIPPRVLVHQGSRISVFLRALSDDIRTFGCERAHDLALAAGPHLPERLRNATFRDLAIEIVLASLKLAQELVNHPAVVRTTAATLDSAVPDWRERFPVRLDSDDVIRLVTGLVDVARAPQPTRPMRVAVHLDGSDGARRLTRSLALPKTLDLASLVDDPTTLPPRLDLLHVRASGVIPLALLVRHDDTYRAEPLTDLVLRDDDASTPVTLALRARGRILGRFTPPGGDPLAADLPSVFTATRDADVYRLTAQGTARFQGHALVLAPRGATVAPPLTPVDTVLDRTLYRVTEATTFQLDEGIINVRPGAQPSDDAYTFTGSHLSDDIAPNQTVFLGPPTAVCVNLGGVRQTIAPTRLRAYIDGAWRPLPPHPLGDLRVRILDASGAIVHAARVKCLPPGAKLDLRPVDAQRAAVSVTVTDADPIALGVTPTPGVVVAQLSPSSVEIAAPPGVATVKLRLLGTGARGLDLTVPFPRTGRRFVTADGAPMPAHATLALDALHTVVAEAWTDPPIHRPIFAFDGRIEAQDVTSVWFDLGLLRPGVHGRRHVLALHAIGRQLERLLSLSATAGARVCLRLRDHLGGTLGAPSLKVCQFETRISYQGKDRTRVFAPRDLALNALRLTDPDTVVDLPRSDSPDGLTSLAPIAEQPGSWMIFGTHNKRLAVVPVLRMIPGEVASGGDLIEAVDLPTHEARANAFLAALTALAETPGDPQWHYIVALLARLDTFPASTFEALRALPHVPQALAVALLIAPDPRAMIRAFETLPWHWATLPVAAMARALEVQRSALGDLAPQFLVDLARPACAALTDRYAGLGVLFSTAAADIPELSTHFPNIEAKLAAARPDLVLVHLGDAINELRQRHANLEVWPQHGILDTLTANAPPPALTQALFQSVPDHVHATLRAPLVAAACSATGVLPTPEEAITLRAAESFDPDYFQDAHRVGLALAIAQHAHGGQP